MTCKCYIIIVSCKICFKIFLSSKRNITYEDVSVVFGHDLRTNDNRTVERVAIEYYIHPLYEEAMEYFLSDMFDIGLIELNITDPLPDSVRSICLPKHNVTNWDNEYAVRAGWGLVNRTTTPLQMSHIKVFGRNEMDRRLDIVEEYYRFMYRQIYRQFALERQLFGTPADRDVLACKVC